MSFINNASSGSQINLLCMIFRILYQYPNKFTENELQEYCAPDSLLEVDPNGKKNKRFKENFKFWSIKPHQLWKTDDNGKFFLDLPLEPNGFEVNDVAHQLRHRLMQISFNDILAEKDEFGASKAIRSFAYLLTQDQFVLFKDNLTTKNIDSSFAKNFAQYSLNNSEKSYFIEFCNFLGISEKDGENEFLDPTRLVKSFLSQIFNSNSELSATEFIKKLANFVPIIDNGKYNLIVRKEINAEVDLPNVLSINLSHALNRLDEEQTLKFGKVSDDINAITLTLPNGTNEQISSIAYTGGK